MSEYLRLDKAFSEDLEYGFLGGQPDVVFTLGPVRAQASALASSQDHNGDFPLGDSSVAKVGPSVPLEF